MYHVFFVLGVVCFDELVVNFRNENLDQFCGTRTFIDIGVYMRFNEGVGSRATSVYLMLEGYF